MEHYLGGLALTHSTFDLTSPFFLMDFCFRYFHIALYFASGCHFYSNFVSYPILNSHIFLNFTSSEGFSRIKLATIFWLIHYSYSFWVFQTSLYGYFYQRKGGHWHTLSKLPWKSKYIVRLEIEKRLREFITMRAINLCILVRLTIVERVFS